MSEELVKGFTCKCGEFHKYTGYVYAHWRHELVFTCPTCDREYDIFEGEATLRGDEEDDELRKFFYDDESYANYLYACTIVDRLNDLLDEGHQIFERKENGELEHLNGRWVKLNRHNEPVIGRFDSPTLFGYACDGTVDGLIVMRDETEDGSSDECDGRKGLARIFSKIVTLDVEHIKPFEI